MPVTDDFLIMNEKIKNFFRIDSYYNARTYKTLNSNTYYQAIFQLTLDSLIIMLQSEDKEIAALYEPHFESILGYLSMYKVYTFNSRESQIEQKIEEKWKRREFINLMREFYSVNEPEYIIHFLGQALVKDIPDIKISSWKVGKYPAHFHDKTRVWAMLVGKTKHVFYREELQQFFKLLEKYYPEGISKQGIHKIPRKKDICQLVKLYAYVPDLWLDLARQSKKESEIITYLRIALCLDQTRYDIWKELIKLDPNYPNTIIPQLDDELNAIINNRIVQAENNLKKEEQHEVAKEVVNKVETLIKRQDAFNEMSQMMRQEKTTVAGAPISHTTSTNLPSYFEYLRGVPGRNPEELFNKVEKAMTTLPGKNLEVIQSMEVIAQKAFDMGNLEIALVTFLTVIHISAQIGEFRHQVIALSNLGIFFSNARRYDIARSYATEAKNLASKNNLLEEKLQALKVLGLIHTNENKNHREKITNLEESAETLRQLGREKERQQLLAQIKTFKEFLDLLGK